MIRTLLMGSFASLGLMLGSATTASAGDHGDVDFGYSGTFQTGYGPRHGGHGQCHGGGYGYPAPRPYPRPYPPIGYYPVPAYRPVPVVPVPVYPPYGGGHGHGHGYGYGYPAPGVGFSNRNFSLWLGR
jgi:hypothetical protein